MTPEAHQRPANEASKEASAQKAYTIIRWVIAGFFALFALINGLHVSILFFFSAAFLMLPFPAFASSGWKHHMITVLSMIAACALFFTGALLSPMAEENAALSGGAYHLSADPTNPSIVADTDTDAASSDTESHADTQPSDETDHGGNTSSEGETSTIGEDIAVVWISASGSKYHARPDCSNMASPTETSVESAVNEGFEPCKRCIKSE